MKTHTRIIILMNLICGYNMVFQGTRFLSTDHPTLGSISLIISLLNIAMIILFVFSKTMNPYPKE